MTASQWSEIGSGTWLFESLSLLLSIGCIGAVAAVLATSDGEPLSQWHMPIQPNALISVFTTIAKAALIYPVAECISQFKWLYFGQDARRTIDLQRFDDASRGPWGSFCFLLHCGDKAILVTIGCIITILAMAIDPFAQQIITYPTRIVITNAPLALTRRAQGYDSGSTTPFTLATAQQIDPGVQGSILMGVYGKPGSPFFHCDTGNCAFPDTSTLGLCGSCKDVTADSHAECGPGDGASILTACNVTTPSGFNLSAVFGESGSATTYWTKLDSIASAGNGSDSLVNFGLIKGPADDGGRAIDDDRTVSECSLRLCGRTYHQFNVTNNVLNTFSTTTRTLNNTGFLNSNKSTTTTYLIFETIPVGSDPPNNYIINGADYKAISATLIALFSTTLFSDNAAFNFGGGNAPDAGKLGGFDISNVLYESPNISQIVNNVAGRTTDFIQSAASTELVFSGGSTGSSADNAAKINATTSTVDGDTFSPETFIHVSWLWFILPAGLVVLAVVFLVVTAMVNRAHQGQVWKSSSLPYLYHPLVGEAEEFPRSLEKLRDMDARARMTSTQLSRTEEGNLRFAVLQ